MLLIYVWMYIMLRFKKFKSSQIVKLDTRSIIWFQLLELIIYIDLDIDQIRLRLEFKKLLAYK